MTFAQENGYTPVDFDAIMSDIREEINTQFGTTYTEENFVGTNWYKYFYALVQKVQENEIKTSEVFAKLQEYIALTNDRIQRPSVSAPGLVESFESEGYIASVKPPSEADRGLISICVDTDSGAVDYADTKLAICTLISQFVAAAIVSQGTESENITLSNGQEFEFKYSLPTKTPILLRLTLTTSENNLLTIPSDEELRQMVYDQITARYRLGWNFEPQKYFTLDDAPWAATVLLEYSTNDGGAWGSDVFDADFDDLYTFDLEDIQILVDP